MNTPQAPSAQQTAAAQTASNVDTAKAQAQLNNVNQVTPYGNLTYTSTTGKDGIPQYTATTTLTPEQQALLGKQNQLTSNLADVGVTESQKLGDLLSTPFDANKATEDNLDALASARLDPALAKQQASLEQQLANKGIKPGTEAYNNAMTLNSQSANDARNQLYLTGHSQAYQEALSNRAQPLNEILALASGSQIQQPSFQSTPTTGVQGTDVAGITNTSYQNQLNQSNGFWNALGSAGGTIGGWLFSSEKLKTDIHDTGAETKDGIPLKTFRYKGSPMLNMGVMAEDAQRKRPDAVRSVGGGVKQVNYDKLGSPMLRLGKAA